MQLKREQTYNTSYFEHIGLDNSMELHKRDHSLAEMSRDKGLLYYGEEPDYSNEMDSHLLSMLKDIEPPMDGQWYLYEFVTYGRSHTWKKNYYFKLSNRMGEWRIVGKWFYLVVYGK